MSYASLSVFIKGLILLLQTCTLFGYIYALVRAAVQGREKRDFLLPVTMTGQTFVLFELMTMIQQGDVPPRFMLPVPVLLAVVFLSFLHMVYLQYSLNEWQSTHLTAMSVKEAFDRLPVGLLYYTGAGVPILVNETMQRIWLDLTGGPVLDAGEFHETLRRLARTDPPPADEDHMILRVPGGAVYSIKRELLDAGGKPLYELTAVDVSREYALTGELESRRDRQKHLNNRLKVLMNTIEYVTMNREILQLKVALHDNIGQSILLARRYLHTPESIDRGQMLDFWRGNLRHLIKDEPEEWELPYYVISRQADQLGIHLEILGELPREQRLIPVVDAAISIHIGNTLKHAGGSRATVEVRREAGDYVLVFTNDGSQPAEEITERGGLVNLRREVEAAGGTMREESTPRFALILRLPGDKEAEDGI